MSASTSRLIKCVTVGKTCLLISYVPIILVGTKIDLREDEQFFVEHPGAIPISTAQGEELKKMIGASAYIECSSKTQENVKAVFDEAIKVVMQAPQQGKKKNKKGQKGCTIL